MDAVTKYFLIVQVAEIRGCDTYLRCGILNSDGTENEQPLYLVVNAHTGIVVDGGYQTFVEAKTAWPEAINLV